ncbi:hypothetical protein AcW1_009242 [Taiwanofungus camphoratus]|nr:hypothetical protein AcW1_009242 [Antrodia cinnamomea]
MGERFRPRLKYTRQLPKHVEFSPTIIALFIAVDDNYHDDLRHGHHGGSEEDNIHCTISSPIQEPQRYLLTTAMLASTPNTEYVSFRTSKRDHSVSPSCRTSLHSQTPPRFTTDSLTYDSPMLTPSPLRRHALPTADPMDTDDIFQSPVTTSSYTHHPRKEIYSRNKPHVAVVEDEDDCEDALFLAPSFSLAHPRNLVTPTSPLLLRTPLRTPVKQTHWPLATPDRPALSEKRLNTPFPVSPGHGVGTKRTPTPICTTPLHNRTLTPLNVTSASVQRQSDCAAMAFDRLAPLSAPRFNPRTPQTKAETDMYLKHQAETMTLLKISDMGQSGDESGYDSGAEGRETKDDGQRLFFRGNVTPFSATKAKTKSKTGGHGKSPGLEMFISRNDDEVAETVSPSGHITKRRARSRPVSAELLESANNTPVPPLEHQAKATPRIKESQSTSMVAFPSAPRSRTRRTSASSTSSSETSPLSRNRLPTGTMPRTRTQSHSSQTRGSLNRLSSSSSATLFFGPSIPNANVTTKRSHKSSLSPIPSSACNRHSYVAPTASRWPLTGSSSPVSSPPRKRQESSSDDEADFFFNGGPPETSFSFSITEGTPSPKKKQRRETPSPLPRKFRPRDSGIALDSSDDDGALLVGGMPRASTSVSTVNSESEDVALVTPGVGPGAASGWPGVDVVGADEEGMDGVDAFIVRTLAAGASTSARGHHEPKKVPGTPVKRVKTAYLIGGVTRPWQSAVANKIGFPEFDEDLPMHGKGRGKGKGKPRKSLPAAFPVLDKENGGGRKDHARGEALKQGGDTDVEDDANVSPTLRRDGGRYEGLGLGRPASNVLPSFARPGGDGKGGRTSWLMRRSSSGAFSSGSETSVTATPTRSTPKDWGHPPRLPISPLKNSLDFSGIRSGSSSSTSTAVNSPTVEASIRHAPAVSLLPRRSGTSALPQPTPKRGLFCDLTVPRPQTHAHPARLPRGHASPSRRGRLSLPTSEEQPGRFEREFVEIDELGSGEFGRVMKVRHKDAQGEGEVFAIKKSKPFEGAKHRLRLREEVDILAHLSTRGGHPNVLAYIDSWEEDETLYIRTELCGLGNLAHFLWSYGRAFPRLDEGRVWRILAELSAGLHFIHDAGVIHLDLKPANIFLTGSGRLKIGDFGMASLWPRPPPADASLSASNSSFEREGDKLYLAPEVLQGRYGKAADVFSLGMTMLEAATNVVVPDQGEAWHRLRREDFAQVDLALLSAELRALIREMMRSEPALRVQAAVVAEHKVVVRARRAMERVRAAEGDVFRASAFAGAGEGFLDEILGREVHSESSDGWDWAEWEGMDVGV